MARLINCVIGNDNKTIVFKEIIITELPIPLKKLFVLIFVVSSNFRCKHD